MKKIAYFLSVAWLTSCAPIIHYQVLKVNYDKLLPEKDALLFENEQCKVIYNFWEENGNIGFVFYNKSEKTIYIDKSECFFILNGIANDYFQNRTYTKSSSVGVSAGKGSANTQSSGSQSGSSISYAKSETNLRNAISTGILSTSTAGANISYSENLNYAESNIVSQGISFSKGFSVSYSEMPVIIVPPKSFKIISEYKILSYRFKGCDLIDYPSRDIKSLSFNKENSPYVFSNRICYKVDSLEAKPIYIINDFFVSEVSNMPSDKFYYEDYETICGERSYWKVKFRKFASPDSFYIEY